MVYASDVRDVVEEALRKAGYVVEQHGATSTALLVYDAGDEDRDEEVIVEII